MLSHSRNLKGGFNTFTFAHLFAHKGKNPIISLVNRNLSTVDSNYCNVLFSSRGSSAAAPGAQRDFSSSTGYGGEGEVGHNKHCPC